MMMQHDYFFLGASAVCAIVVVLCPPYREITLDGSAWLWNYGSTGWAESTHGEPVQRYALPLEICTYCLVATVNPGSRTAAYCIVAANFFTIVFMYLRSLEANNGTYDEHNTLQHFVGILLAALILNVVTTLSVCYPLPGGKQHEH